MQMRTERTLFNPAAATTLAADTNSNTSIAASNSASGTASTSPAAGMGNSIAAQYGQSDTQYIVNALKALIQDISKNSAGGNKGAHLEHVRWLKNSRNLERIRHEGLEPRRLRTVSRRCSPS